MRWLKLVRDYDVCPKCGGTGEIPPKFSEEQLVEIAKRRAKYLKSRTFEEWLDYLKKRNTICDYCGGKGTVDVLLIDYPECGKSYPI